VPLKGEISMIRDYIALESIRYGDQIEINIKTEGNCENKLIAPLLLIPVVENSFKHGASKMINHQWVNMEIKIKEDDLYFLIENKQTGTAWKRIAQWPYWLEKCKKKGWNCFIRKTSIEYRFRNRKVFCSDENQVAKFTITGE
jgi:LytS/YehU family sensor histidine kinase